MKKREFLKLLEGSIEPWREYKRILSKSKIHFIYINTSSLGLDKYHASILYINKKEVSRYTGFPPQIHLHDLSAEIYNTIMSKGLYGFYTHKTKNENGVSLINMKMWASSIIRLQTRKDVDVFYLSSWEISFDKDSLASYFKNNYNIYKSCKKHMHPDLVKYIECGELL